MERALMLLAKQSSAAKAIGVSSSTRPSGVVVKDKNANAVEVGVEVDVVETRISDGIELRERKRTREREDGLPHRVFSKPTPSAESELPPIIRPTDPVAAVRVEVSPHQRWTAGPNAPVQVFQVFDLPQDLNSYINKSRAEVTERCLTRGGRFLADLTHIVNAYKTDIDLRGSDHLARELAEVKAEKLEAEKRAAESERREAEAAKKNFEGKAKLMEENNSLKEKMIGVGEELERSKVSIEMEKKKIEELEKEVGMERAEMAKLKEENSALKAEVEKGVSDIAKALGVGYGYYYDRLAGAGIDLASHSFDDYCTDLAKSMPLDANNENPSME